MNLTPIASNMTELEINGYAILFSYKTPVACIDPSGQAYATDKFWSKTTSRHINKWFNAQRLSNTEYKTDILEAPQEYFDSLIAQVK